MGPQARILNPDDIIIGMKKKDVKEVLVGSNEKPWLLVGRPGNNYLLCFKRQEGKREERKGGRSWKKKVFKRRSTVFGTNLVIGNENEVNFCYFVISLLVGWIGCFLCFKLLSFSFSSKKKKKKKKKTVQ